MFATQTVSHFIINTLRRLLVALCITGGVLVIFAIPSPSVQSKTSIPIAIFAQPRSVINACAEINADTTWVTGNIYLLENCNLVVATGATLTLQPGVIVKFWGTSPGYGSAQGSVPLVVDGTLNAIGTADQPIIFTSYADDAHGGDTNNDGVSSGSAGDWYGLVFRTGSIGRLQHFFVGYAGSGRFNSAFGYGRAQIDLKGAEVALQDGTITTGLTMGIYLESPHNDSLQATLSNVTVTDNDANGVYLDAAYQSTLRISWNGGSISRNGLAGVDARTYFSAIYPTLKTLVIEENGRLATSDWQKRGIAFERWNYGIHPVLEKITFRNNAGTAMTWFCGAGSMTAHDLTATGNDLNAIVIQGGPVDGNGCSGQWDFANVGIPVQVNGRIAVMGSGLLSILSGTTLLFEADAGLEARDNSALYILGTRENPVVLTALSQTAGAWHGVSITGEASGTLRHCEIGYGGGWGYNLEINSNKPHRIENCDIHHSSGKGLFSYRFLVQPVVRYNRFHDNAAEAVANRVAAPLDARYNWWGSASGPHHTWQNPSGQGDDVGDNVLFYPWLTQPNTSIEPTGKVLISTGSPRQISPGEQVEYAIQYLSVMTETVHNGVLLLQLPQASYFVDGTAGAIYWPERHQLIWKLGDLPVGANGYVSARVRFHWGLSADYSDGSLTQFAGENYNATAFDVAQYNAYQNSTPKVSGVVAMSGAEFEALWRSNPDLQTLYQLSLDEGFSYIRAANLTYSDGSVVVSAILRTADRQDGRILNLGSQGVIATTVGGGKLAIRDRNGGMTADLLSQRYEFWGSWMPNGAERATATCTESRCFYNCMIKAQTWGAVAGKVAGMVSWVFPPVGATWTAYELYDTYATYTDCKTDCASNPTTHCCAVGETRWSPTGLKQQCAQYSCDAVGTWKQTPDIIDKCTFGERCVAGGGITGGCKECEEELIRAQFNEIVLRDERAICANTAKPNCSELTTMRAKDPNAIYGPLGDLLPQQTATYTITYENEGIGRAYGVFVINQLPTPFDERTLNLYGKGQYLPESRELVWSIGELGTKGDPTSQGMISYTVTLTNGLPSGTVVSNQATVYFPSVPEETPTNSWVNLLYPLTAMPQNLTTHYQAPLAITLVGRDVSDAPLTYRVIQPPHGGTLTGTPPHLTYRSAENFTGEDEFLFQVSNGVTESRQAQVRISVLPDGDTTPPQQLWTSPKVDEREVAIADTPQLTDEIGAIYTPIILIGFSERLQETTITAATITLKDNQGVLVATTASFDNNNNQLVIYPRRALSKGRYTVTVTPQVTDLAGNPLATILQWNFTTLGAEEQWFIYLPLVLR